MEMFQNQLSLYFKISVIIVLNSHVMCGYMFRFVLAYLVKESDFGTSETYFWK